MQIDINKQIITHDADILAVAFPNFFIFLTDKWPYSEVHISGLYILMFLFWNLNRYCYIRDSVLRQREYSFVH